MLIIAFCIYLKKDITNRHKYIFLILDALIIVLYLLFLVVDIHLFKIESGYSPFAIIIHLVPLVLSILFSVQLILMKYKSLFSLLSILSITVGLSVYVIANLSVGVNIFKGEWALTDVDLFSSLALLGYAIFLVSKFKGNDLLIGVQFILAECIDYQNG